MLVTANGFAVSTETVEQYITETAAPALAMFQQIAGWLAENNPRKYGPELLIGTRPELPGTPTEFWTECERFINGMLELYDIIETRQHDIIETLGLIVTNGQQSVALYRKTDDEIAGVLNGLLRDLNERR